MDSCAAREKLLIRHWFLDLENAVSFPAASVSVLAAALGKGSTGRGESRVGLLS